GIDIFEANPFQYHKSHSNSNLAVAGQSALDHYALNSVKKAIDTVSDPEVVEYNLMVAPGLTHQAITNHMVSTCENRGDALAIIDIEEDYCPPNVLGSAEEADRMPDVDKAITQMRMRSINSSYGCAFFPWVQISDSMSGRVLWAPPSIVALGTMASSTKRSELWFAPAGFTRGGLTDGSAGIPVNGVRLRLNSKERDKLYEANINPIAQFPAEGIVIFGQKTLQLTPSALDRINVRRLMIYLKKEVSRMAKTILFDQNVKTTWTRFISKADPFLASVKSRFGLTEYKIILDETTTTPDLIDRNIMYAKILLKPAKAIEYIAIDFVITDSGASFDD
ncbi:MAG: phage tail sheath C-terminal domain-containing protein, partial [bacterium]